MNKLKAYLKSSYVWTFSTYYAEGFPYGIIRLTSDVFFKAHNVSLQAIGLTSLYGLPWTLKFLWGPYIEAISTKRKWLLLMQATLVMLILAIAFATTLPSGIKIVAILFFISAIFSATNDIATDGYYMEALDKDNQAKFVGNRVMAYRIALITTSGFLIYIAGLTNWFTGYFLGACILGLFFLFHVFFLAKVEVKKRSLREILNIKLVFKIFFGAAFLYGVFWAFKYIFASSTIQNILNPIMPIINKISLPGKIGIGLLLCLTLIALNLKRLKKRFIDKDSFYAKSFVSFLDQEKIGLALVFILIFRTGESLLFSMSRPFFMDIGVTISQIGIISGTFGTISTILGSIIGGFLIAKKGLDKTIWPIILAQNFTNLIYAALAYKYYYLVGHIDQVQANLYLSGLVILIDNFASGMGSALFTVYLMRTCKIEYKTSHFAIVTGLMTVSSTFAGVLSGFLASSLGYPIFFLISFFASIPSMALIFFIPFLNNKEG